MNDYSTSYSATTKSNAGLPISPPDPDELKRRVDLRDLFAERYGPGRKAGRARQYPSPYRTGDDHPSFTVYTDGFKDFGGSGDSGDVYQWLALEYGFEFSEAVQWVARRVGQGSAPMPAAATAAPDSAHSEPPPAAWQHAAQQLLDQCQRALWTPAGQYALDYLRGRGLDDSTIRAAGLGFNPDWKRSGYTKPDGKPAYLPPGIVIPWLMDGALWALRVRTLPKYNGGRNLDKYLSFTGSRLAGALYHADALEPARAALIVEGEFDCLLAAQHLGELLAVVTLGSASSLPARRWRDRLAEAGQVYALFDNDAAGQAASARLAEQLPDLIALHLPGGKDITEYVQSGGDLGAWFAAATAPAGEPTIVTVGMEQALNAHGSKGEALLWYVVCAGRARGLIPISAPVEISLDDLEASAEAAGFSTCRKTLARYAKASEIILHPVDDSNTGCNFVLSTAAAMMITLKQRASIDLRVRAFRAEPVDRADSATGETYTLPAVVADLEPLALEDGGLPSEETASAADLLKDQPFDALTCRLRRGASKWARSLYAAFCAGLDSPRVIPLPDGMSICTEGDLKRAQARAWHMAGLEGFQTVREQMRALGIQNKNTLYAVLADAGIDREENIIQVTLQDGDLRTQVRKIRDELKASPKTYKLVLDTGEFERKPYSLDDIEADRRRGTVILECQAPNLYHVGELPPEREESRPRKPIAVAEKKAKQLPRQKPPRRGHYPERWVRGQLRLRYKLLHKCEAPDGATVRELVAALIADPILASAVELGAVVRKVEAHEQA